VDRPYVTFDYLQQVEAAREAPEQFLSRFQLALNMPGKEVLPRRQFMCFNPLHTSPAAAVPDT
jgi:hypothetical protein